MVDGHSLQFPSALEVLARDPAGAHSGYPCEKTPKSQRGLANPAGTLLHFFILLLGLLMPSV